MKKPQQKPRYVEDLAGVRRGLLAPSPFAILCGSLLLFDDNFDAFQFGVVVAKLFLHPPVCWCG